MGTLLGEYIEKLKDFTKAKENERIQVMNTNTGEVLDINTISTNTFPYENTLGTEMFLNILKDNDEIVFHGDLMFKYLSPNFETRFVAQDSDGQNWHQVKMEDITPKQIHLSHIASNSNVEVIVRYKDDSKPIKFYNFDTTEIYNLMNKRLFKDTMTYNKYNNTIKNYVKELNKEKEYILSRIKYETLEEINQQIESWNDKLKYFDEIENTLSKTKIHTDKYEDDMKSLCKLSQKLVDEDALS